MPRRPKPRFGDKRYKPKKKKRPRGWHRRAKKPLWQIWRELQRDKAKKGVAIVYERTGRTEIQHYCYYA